MPAIIDPDTLNVDKLPGIWSPVQWELTKQERAQEIEVQAIASLLWAVDTPEAILRRLLDEEEVEQLGEPPDGYDPELQGEWDPDLITFQFKRPFTLVSVERDSNYVLVEYQIEGLGRWLVEITPTKVNIERV